MLMQKTAAVNFAFTSGTKREVARSLTEDRNRLLKEEQSRIQEEQQEQRRNRQRPRRTGNLRLSNTDSLGRAFQVRSRLAAKLMEIQGSGMEPGMRDSTIMDIKLQLGRVDQQIAAIRRRERAVQQERTTRRSDDTPEIRRRRARDMQERRIYVRRDMLYHANNGGFDPNDPIGLRQMKDAMSSVAFEIAGSAGTMEMAPGVDLAADFNMELML